MKKESFSEVVGHPKYLKEKIILRESTYRLSYKDFLPRKINSFSNSAAVFRKNQTTSSSGQGMSGPASLVKENLEDLVHPRTKNPVRLGMISTRTSLEQKSNSEVIYRLIEDACFSQEYDLIVGPEYTFRGPLNLQESINYRKRLKRVSESGTAIIPGTFVTTTGSYLLNGAFIYDQGEEIFSYTKMNDGGEIFFANQNNLTAKFGETLGVFSLWGYKCGIEICADSRDEKTLGSGVLYANGVYDLDIYFLISCGVTSPSMGCIRKNGYGIVVDGSREVCRITKN